MGANRAFWGAVIALFFAGSLSANIARGQVEAPPGVAGVAQPAEIPTEDTLETTYGLGMGAGVRAGATAVSGLAYNASNMAAIPTYHVEAFSQIIPGSRDSGGTYWTIGSAITDSTTAKKLALGTSFRGVFSGDGRQYRGWDWRSAIGVQAIPQLGLGLGFRWAQIRSDTVDGQRLGPSFDGITLDASITVTPIPWLKLAGLGYNLIKTYSALAPQMAGGSVSLSPIEAFIIGGDVLVDFTTFEQNELIAGAGITYVAGEMVPLRFGYRHDGGRDLNQITAAIGFNRNKIATEFALRQDVGGRKESYLLIMFRYVVE